MFPFREQLFIRWHSFALASVLHIFRIAHEAWLNNKVVSCQISSKLLFLPLVLVAGLTAACTSSGCIEITQSHVSCAIEALPLCAGVVLPGTVDLELSKISSIGPLNSTAFTNIPANLSSLTMSEASLTSVLDASFASFGANLHSLELVNLPLLTFISSAALLGLSSLSNLRISSTSLTTLPSTLCIALSSLRRLDLSNNALLSAPDDLFGQLNMLSYLNISNNHLTLMHSNAFSNMTALIALDLSFNAITSVHLSTLSALPNLTALNMAGNTLVCIATSKGPHLCTCKGNSINTRQSIHCGHSCLKGSTTDDCYAACIPGFEGGSFSLASAYTGPAGLNVANCSRLFMIASDYFHIHS